MLGCPKVAPHAGVTDNKGWTLFALTLIGQTHSSQPGDSTGGEHEVSAETAFSIQLRKDRSELLHKVSKKPSFAHNEG